MIKKLHFKKREGFSLGVESHVYPTRVFLERQFARDLKADMKLTDRLDMARVVTEWLKSTWFMITGSKFICSKFKVS